MMPKYASFLAIATILASVIGVAAQSHQPKSGASGPSAACSALKGRTFDNNTSIVEITAAAVAACDQNDGLADGIIAAPRSCRFDPRSMTCSGSDSNSCLTAPQAEALQKIYDGPANPRTGESVFPGFARGSEAGWTGMVRPAPASSGLLVYFSNLLYRTATGISGRSTSTATWPMPTR